MSNPNRRRRPVWCGDVDTTRPGAAWDVQDDGCCGPCKPPVPGCGPVRPPMPQFPDCGYHIPPVQYVPGMNEQEQLANLNCKMNELIELFNCNTDKVYGAYEEVVRSAVCNDAFYKEITVESGYLADASTSYELVHIPYVDCACQPIYMEMGLAYNNTTNSGVTESVFDKALEVYADKILPAAERGFQGVAIWKGAPIYSGETHGDTRALIPGQCDYTLGVTENGYFKIYDTPNDRDNTGMIKTMRQDKVRNSMGCAVIIRGGEYVVDENLADMELPCTVMAMNYKTKERFILAIGKDNVASAITPEIIANLLKKYDVDVAALTSWGQQSYLLDKGQFSFMPTSTDSDGIPTVPQSAAFWYITKRRHFHNDYVKEVAALTIQMGENLWYDELTSEAVDNLKVDFVKLRNDLEQEIQDRKDADDALGERIDKEIADRESADTALDEKYAAEVSRLDGEIDTLSQRVTAEVTRLDALIQSTKEALTAKDVKEVKVTHDGTRDTYQVVLNDGTVLGADVIVYNYDQLVQKLDSYATVEQRLDAEIQARKDADDALNALITAEQQARANGDTALSEQIASVRTELTELIQGNTTDITALQGALDTLTQTVQSNYTSLNERVTSNAENIANLQGSYGALQATVAALNETVTGLQQSFASTEQSFENVKQTVASMQEELNAFEERIEGELGNYLPLSGGTVTGTVVFNADINFKSMRNIWFESSEGEDMARFAYSGVHDAIGIYGPRSGGAGGSLYVTGDIIQTSRGNLFRIGDIYGVSETPETTGIGIFNTNGLVQFFVDKPTHDYAAANKAYVDAVGENLAGEIAEVGGQLGNYLPLRGGTLTGTLAMRADIAMELNRSIKFNGEGGVGAVITWDKTASRLAVNHGPLYIQQNLQFVGLDKIFKIGSINTLSETPNISGVGIYQGTNLAEFYVGTPSHDYAAANKAYVDAVGENLAGEIAEVGGQLSNYLPLSGGQMRGALDMNFKNVENIKRIGFGEAGNSRYYTLFDEETLKLIKETSSSSSIGYFNVDCGAITSYRGSLGLGVRIHTSANSTASEPILDITGITDSAKVRVTNIATPVLDDDVATKGYVDAAVAGGASGNYLPLTGGTVTGPTTFQRKVTADTIDMSGGANGNILGAMTVEFELTQQGPSGYAIMRNDTLNGFGAYNESAPTPFAVGAPTQDYHAATVGYVDQQLRKYMHGGFSEELTSASINVSDRINGLYLVRYAAEVYMLNVTGNQPTISKLMGTQGGPTFEVSITDDNNMVFTFSESLAYGFQITKLTVGGYVTVNKLS